MVLSGRMLTAVVAALALELMLAASASAGTVSYKDGVFRYRDDPGRHVEIVLRTVTRSQSDGVPGLLSGYATPPVSTGAGCSTAPSRPFAERIHFVCVLRRTGLPRYRLTLLDGDDLATIGRDFRRLRGVIYSGSGVDVTYGPAWRVYGGRGRDAPTGQRVYGGPGNDLMESVATGSRRRSVLRGGTGDDDMSTASGPDWAYGGPGDDHLHTSLSSDMLVGGPGRDLIQIEEATADRAADTFRIRGGGRDEVLCDRRELSRGDVYFADRSDAFVGDCGGRVLFTGRPQLIR
jgi:RTX calcium-binding nonapeptide repeat (4 copies)